MVVSRYRISLVAYVLTVLVMLSLAGSASAQGIHVTLRAQANPFSAYQSYASVWGDGHYAYVGSERRNGVLIFDVANPDAPVQVGYYAPSNSLDMEDVKVANGVGYFADNMGSGLYIVDVSDPSNPQLITQITSANGGFDNTHKIGIWQNFLFIPQNLTAPALIKVFDVSNPATPILKTTFTATDPQWINDVDIQQTNSGQVRLYAAGWGGKCDIWDITNIATSAPVLLGSFSAGIDGSSASATDDGNYLAYSRKTTDGTSEVTIYNITNPAAATVASTLTMPALGIDAVAPHDPKIMGNLLYVSWYQAGTLIFDITNPNAPVMVGSYDTWPGAVLAAQLDGNWGVYPYLGQDRVLLSDRNTGLYIVDATGVNSQPALYNFKLNPTSVVGPLSSTGTVYLVGLGASDGSTIANLSSNSSLAVVPPTVTVPSGANSAAFSVTTTGVATKSTATLTASFGGATDTAVLTITPEIPSKLAFSPTSLLGGLTTTGTVTMAATASMNTVVTLTVTSGSSAVASIPANVTVLAGSSTATFAVTTNTVSSATTVKVSAAANGTTVTGTFTVTGNVPTSLKFSPTSIIGGLSTTGTVTMAATASANISVVLTVTSGNSAVASIPASVTVLAGSNTASFTVTTNAVSSATTVKISAAANGTTVTGTFTATGNIPSTFKFTPSSLIGGASSTGTVTLSVNALTATTVTLTVTAGSSAVGSIPSSVIVPAGSNTANFTLVTNAVASKTTITVSAAANGGTKAASITVNTNPPTSVTFTPNSVLGGASSTGKVIFGQAVATDTVVTLTILTGSSAVASMPATVTVPAGSTSTTWTLVTNKVSAVTTVQVSAAANGGSKIGTLTVKATTLSAFTFTPSSVTGGGTVTGNVTFNQTVGTDTAVTLVVQTSAGAVASIPGDFVISAGSSTGSFTLTTLPVSSTTVVQIVAVANGSSKTASLTVN